MNKNVKLKEVKRIWGKAVAEEVKKVAQSHNLDPETIDINTCDAFDPEITGYVSRDRGLETNECEAEYHYYKSGWDKGPCWKRDVVYGRYCYGDGDCSFQMISLGDEINVIKREYEKLHPDQRLLGVAFGLHYDLNEYVDIKAPQWAWLYTKLWLLPSLYPQISYNLSCVTIAAPTTITQRINVAKVENKSNLYMNLEDKVFRLVLQKLVGNSSLINDDRASISKKTEALREYEKRYQMLKSIVKEKEKLCIGAYEVDLQRSQDFSLRPENKHEIYDHGILRRAQLEVEQARRQLAKLVEQYPQYQL